MTSSCSAPALDSRDSLRYKPKMNFVRKFLPLLFLAGLLGACGVKGDPEPPPGSDPNKNKDRPIVLDKLI